MPRDAEQKRKAPLAALYSVAHVVERGGESDNYPTEPPDGPNLGNALYCLLVHMRGSPSDVLR